MNYTFRDFAPDVPTCLRCEQNLCHEQSDFCFKCKQDLKKLTPVELTFKIPEGQKLDDLGFPTEPIKRFGLTQ